jgi:hypothetical protein
MATSVTTSADAIAREFAAAIRDEPGIDQLWLRPYDDRLELRLILKDVDHDTELRLAEAFASLICHYPNARIRPMLMHPADFVPDTVLADQMPNGARQIALRD